jgi:hypothetical protein
MDPKSHPLDRGAAACRIAEVLGELLIIGTIIGNREVVFLNPLARASCAYLAAHNMVVAIFNLIQEYNPDALSDHELFKNAFRCAYVNFRVVCSIYYMKTLRGHDCCPLLDTIHTDFLGPSSKHNRYAISESLQLDLLDTYASLPDEQGAW